MLNYKGMKMKFNELNEMNLIEFIDNNKYKCKECSKVLTKLGICNHYFYCHTEEGKKKKEELSKIAKENNNKPEIKEKISRGTKLAFQRDEVRTNYLNAINST